MCFNGEGRGQMKVFNQKFRFSFESKKLNSSTWAIGISMPLKGELRVNIPIHWEKLSQSEKTQIMDKLKNDLLNTWPKDLQNGPILNLFLSKISALLVHGDATRKEDNDLSRPQCMKVKEDTQEQTIQCHLDPAAPWYFEVASESHYWSSWLDENYKVNFNLTDEKNSRFTDFFLSLVEGNSHKYQGPLFQLELHFAMCE